MMGVEMKTHDVPLPLRLGLLVVPGLVSVGVRLPGVLQDGVDEGFADQDAQIDNQVGVHRPGGKTQKIHREGGSRGVQ